MPINRVERTAEPTEEQKETLERAKVLLKDVCTEKQWEEFAEQEKITIRAKSGTLFELSLSGTVMLRPGGHLVGPRRIGICVGFKDAYQIIPRDYTEYDLGVYQHDRLVAVKLLLESDEAKFHEVIKE